jgi:uncharacterized membrane protein YvlD (DUF360 family)
MHALALVPPILAVLSVPIETSTALIFVCLCSAISLRLVSYHICLLSWCVSSVECRCNVSGHRRASWGADLGNAQEGS